MKLKRKYKVEPVIPLSSMADLAMLLLVFFVICGKATTRALIPIEPPVSLTAEAMGKDKQVVITVDAEGQTYLDERAVDAKELIAELEAIMDQRTDRATRTVRIEVDRRTAYRDYVIAVDAVNRVKGYVELKVKQ
jgi:biopolymer transport protein ExbD